MFDADGYREDMERWEELAMGKTYTVDEFLDGLNREDLSAFGLYPVVREQEHQDEYDVVIGEELDVPLYDHEREEVRVPAKKVDWVLEMLEQRVAERSGWFPGDPLHEREDRRRCTETVRNYGGYTVRVEE